MSKTYEKLQIPLKRPLWHDIRQVGPFFRVELLKLKKLWHKNIIRNNVTKNHEDLTIFGAVTLQLVYFLVPIYFSKFLAVNLWKKVIYVARRFFLQHPLSCQDSHEQIAVLACAVDFQEVPLWDKTTIFLLPNLVKWVCLLGY